MNATGRENKKTIYAIKFKDLPFPEIDKFVCIPHSWIIHRIRGQKVLAAYPKNEAPFVTRNRTKKREGYCQDWRFYIGIIKFESENYEEVINWIEENIANGNDDQDEEIQDPPVKSRQLRSAKNPVLSGTLPKKPHLAVKLYDNPRRPLPKMLIRRPLPLRPWKPKPIGTNKPVQPPVSSANTSSKEQSGIVKNQEILNSIKSLSKQSVDTSAQSPPKSADERQPTPKPTDGRQSSPVQDERLSMPDNNDSNVEAEIEIEFESNEKEKSSNSELAQPNPALDHHDYLLIESRLHEIHTGQPKQVNDIQKTSPPENQTARPPSRAAQASQHHDVQPVKTPSSKQQGSVGTSSEVTYSCQNSVQGFEKTVPSTTYYTPNPIDLSFRQQIPAIRRKSLAAIKKPVEKKARLENVSKTLPTTQQFLYNMQLPNYAGNVGDQRHPVQGMNSADKNLSHLAYHARFYESSQLQYIQQIAQMQGMINQPNPYMNQRSYLSNPMTGYVPHQSSQIDPSQFLLSQNQRPLVSTNQISELRRELIAPSVQNQSARNLEYSHRQDRPSYQDLRTVNSLEFQSNPKPQVAEVAEIPVALQEINQQLSIDRRNNSRKDLLAKLSLSPMKCIEILPALKISKDSETQSTSELQEVQPKILDVYLRSKSETQKADQVTEMETDDQLKDGIPSFQETAECGYDTDKPAKKQESQKVTDSEMLSADEELMDNVSSVGSDYYANEDYSEGRSITDETSMDVSNFVPDIQEKLSKVIESEMLEVHGLLLTKMYKNFVATEEYYNSLRVNTLGCLKLYEVLLNKAEKINVIESLTNSTPNAPEVQVTSASELNSNSDRNNKSSVDTSKNSPKNNKRRHTFVLPPEYDPNDSRWTLKHREPGPGLIELKPQSRVYVKKAEYKNCIRASNDCRMLARLLLTIVFSKNALSVCSLTGAKARAFNNVDIDVRPGLDEHARMVLLAFIEEYGNKRNWNTSDTAGIMSSIRTKIQEMRNKYGKTKVV